MKVEEVIINGKMFKKTTAEQGYELVKVGTDAHYIEAIDLPTSNYEYTEVLSSDEEMANTDTD